MAIVVKQSYVCLLDLERVSNPLSVSITVKYRNEKSYLIEKCVGNLKIKVSSDLFMLAVFSAEKVKKYLKIYKSPRCENLTLPNRAKNVVSFSFKKCINFELNINIV